MCTLRSATLVLMLLGLPFFSAWAQTASDLNRLLHPEVAEDLGLDDAQRATLQALVQEKSSAIAATPENAAAISKEYETKILAALTPEQRSQLQAGKVATKLKFNFREQKWDDVLEWFARQDNLSLVMDSVPAGTFTYSDTRSYTPAQAIDLLNSVLLTRGFTLIRQQRMLIVIELSDSIPLEFFPRVTLEQLPARGRFEMVSVEFDIGTRPMDQVLQTVEPYLGQFGRIIPLVGTRKVLVVETAGKMEMINVLISSVPIPKPVPQPQPPAKPPVPVFATYSLGDLDPESTLVTIKSLVSSEQITVDSRTHLLSAFVIPTQQQAIKSFIDQMLAAKEELPGRSLQVYPWKQGSGLTVSEQIQGALPDVTVQFDETTESLFVTATDEEHEQIRAMLTTVAGEPLASDQTVQVYEVSINQVTSVAELLQGLLPTSQVVADATSGRLVVRGTAPQQDQVKAFVEQLAAMNEATSPILERWVRPKNLTDPDLEVVRGLVPGVTITPAADGKSMTSVGDAESQAALKKLLVQWEAIAVEEVQQQIRSIPIEDTTLQKFEELRSSLSAELEGIRFLESRNKGELLVWASGEQLNFLTELLGQLENTAVEPVPDQLQTYPLTASDAALVSELLQERFPDVRLLPGNDGKRLLIWAPPLEQAKIGTFLTELQEQLPVKPEATMKSYQVSGFDLTELQTLLTPVLEDATVTLDEVRGRLLIRAAPAVHVAIDELVKELETPVAEDEQSVLVAYPIEHVDPASVEVLLGRWLEAEQWVMDAKSKQLVVIAPLEKHGRVKAMLQQVDQPGAERGKPEIRAYPIQGVTVASVITLLQPLWPDANLAVDPSASKLLVTATSVEQQEIQEVIQRLNDPQAGDEVRVETYSAPAGNLDTLPSILNQIAPKAVLSIDAANRTLTALASEADHQRIQEAIAQLGKRFEERQVLEIYPVDSATSAELLETVQSLLPGVKSSLSQAGSQLVILAGEPEHQKVKSLLEKISQQREQAGGLLMKVYRLESETPGTLLSLVQQTLPTAEVIQVSTSGPVAVWAREAEHAKLEEVLGQVGSEADRDTTSLKMYQLPAGRGAAFGLLLAQQRPTAQIALGAGTDQQVVSDTDQGHKKIAEIVVALRDAVQQAGDVELKSHAVRPDLNVSARATILEAIPQIKFVEGTPLDKLLVWATPQQHDDLDQLIEKLQNEIAAPPNRVIQIHALENVDKARAITILQETVDGLEFLESARENELTLWATQDRQQRVAEMLAQLKNLDLSDASVEVRVFPFDSDKVLADTISEALTGQIPTGVSLQINAGTNSLLAYGSKTGLDELAQLVESLESQLPATEKLVSEVYRLRHGTPLGASVVLRTLLPGRAIGIDNATNSLAVTATPTEQTLVAQFVADYDQPEDQGSRVAKVYRLAADADSQDLATVLQQLVPNASFTYRRSPPLVVASATDEELVKIDDVVEQYQAQGQGEMETRVFELQTADVRYLLLAVRAMSPDSSVAGEPTTNRLVVTAFPEEMKRIEQVVEQVDASGDEPRETRVYRLGLEADSQDLSLVLGELVPSAFFTFRRSPPLVVAAGSPEDLLKVDAVVEQYEGAGGAALRTEVFTLEVAEADELENAIQAMNPMAKVASDDSTNTLFVTASEEELAKIKEVIQQVEQGGDTDRVTKVYRLRNGDARDLSEILMQMAPRALIVSDRYPPTIVATASSEDQAKIEEVVKQYQGVGGEDQVTKVFNLGTSDADDLEGAIQDLSPEAMVTSDRSSNSLVVTADASEMEKIEDVIMQVEQVGGEGLLTRVYSLTKGDPEALQEALEPLLPKARFAGDPSTGGLFVTASEEDHKQVALIIEEMDGVDGREPVLKAYAIRNANGDAAYQAVANAMPDTRTVGVSFDPDTSTIFVVGLAADHRRAEQIIQQIDIQRPSSRTRSLKVFSLVGADGPAIEEAVQALFIDAIPEVKVQYDLIQEQLVVVGDETQLKQVEETVKQFERTPRTLEVFPLQENDPRAVQTAISQLFADSPPADRPALSIDEGNGQIFVRATDEQLARIRELLIKLGEPIGQEGQPSGRVRSFPASDQLENAMEQIQDVWPTLRPNRIQVLRIDSVPSRSKPKPATPSQNAPESRSEDEETSEDSCGPVPQVSEQVVSEEKDDSKAEQDTSPIVVVPGISRWTIASDDVEALDQFESLLRSILRQSPSSARMGNFSVYLLKNAGAGQLENLFNDLFRRIGQSNAGTLSRVAIVADERINALIVHGSRSERNTIEELLRVLDSDELMETLQSTIPQIIQVEHSPVDRVIEILESVYRTQLSSGGGRRAVNIPEGVSPEVASVLRQINAASAGPLLTLSSDEATNSIVIRAPVELADEVRSFIARLDEESGLQSAKSINIIRLEGTNSTRMRAAINALLQGQ
jgi:type II secretory pathway component GspD/PulD (secretin)